jgi:peptidoglycan/xylan/chitin deacetylase (PgdA/CDA1 family)
VIGKRRGKGHSSVTRLVRRPGAAHDVQTFGQGGWGAVDRRSFLRRTGLVAGGAAVGLAGGLGTGWADEHYDVALSGHAVGAARPHNPLTMTSIVYRAPITAPMVALTFDDGPSTLYTAKLLAALARSDARATFFQIGRHVRELPALARDVAAAHEIGNHTWSHPDMSLAHAGGAAAQLGRAHEEIADVTGAPPALFRPPYGRFSGATAMIATSMGYPILLWESLFDVRASAADNIRRLSQSAGPGTVILAHDGGPLHSDVVIAALPGLISALRDKGLQPVDVSTLLAAVPGPQPPSTSQPA